MRYGLAELPPYPLFLAPMEDVTDCSFRLLCKQFGADMMFTEFVNADGLVRGAGLQKLKILDKERPVGIQIYGKHIESMVEAAQLVEQVKPEVIDLNFGCPVKKIAGRGAGAGMLQDIPKMLEMTRQVVEVTRTPVTVKTRLGWDDKSCVIEELAEQLQAQGIAGLTIHGRTRAQMYSGSANWEPIAKVKANPNIQIPIIGNGDIKSPEAALQAFERCKVDGVMIGRATYGRPWIFREIKHFLQTGELLSPPDIAERAAIAREHLALSVQEKGEKRGLLEMRRHLTCYFKGLPNFKPLRLQLVTENDPTTLDLLIKQVGIEYANYTNPLPAQGSPWIDE